MLRMDSFPSHVVLPTFLAPEPLTRASGWRDFHFLIFGQSSISYYAITPWNEGFLSGNPSHVAVLAYASCHKLDSKIMISRVKAKFLTHSAGIKMLRRREALAYGKE